MKRLLRSAFQGLTECGAALVVWLLWPFGWGRRRLGRSPRRSLWAGTPIINLAVNARAERTIGVNARSLVYSTYSTTSDFDHDLERLCSIPVLGKLIPYLVFIWATVSVDRFHFYCDRGLLPPRRPFVFNELELRTYRALGIPVFLWTYGADVRSRDTTRALGEPNCCTECTRVGEACICDEELRRVQMEKLRRYSMAIFAMGDMKEYVPGGNGALFCWPVDLALDRFRPVYPTEDGAVRIVHAPNHRMFKGTHFLIEAVKKLQADGLAVELVLVEGMSNREALDVYRTADVVFDQCLIGFHGYFAIEAMAMGKPVLCFVRKPDEYLLAPEECPIVNTGISTLEADLRGLVAAPQELRELGRRGRAYVEKYFTPEAFAERLAEEYRRLGVSP